MKTKPTEPKTAKPVAVSRFRPTIDQLLKKYENLVQQREMATANGLVAEAFVLLVQLEEVEDQLRTAYRRDNFWAM